MAYYIAKDMRKQKNFAIMQNLLTEATEQTFDWFTSVRSIPEKLRGHLNSL